MPRTAFYFTRSAMTGFIVSVLLYRNRVSLREAFEGLEPDERKLSRPVLRGPGSREAAWLLGTRQLAERGLSPRKIHSIVDCSISGHPPFPVILNGHEYVARQARKAGISFTKEGTVSLISLTPQAWRRSHLV